MNRSEQAVTFVTNSQTEILEPLNSLMSRQSLVVKQTSNEVSKLEKEIKAVHAKLEQCKQNMLNKLKEIEGILYTCEGFRRNPQREDMLKADPEIQDRLNIKMGNALRAHKEAAEQYARHYEYTKKFEDQYKTSMHLIMANHQQLAEEKIQTVKDSLSKMLIYETAMEQNHKYDVEQISETIEKIRVDEEVKTIIEENVKAGSEETVRFAEKLEQPKSPWSRLFEIYASNYYEREDFIDYEKVVEETKVYMIRLEDDDYKKQKKLVQDHYKPLFENKAGEESKLDTKELFGNKKGRLAYFDVLKEFAYSDSSKVTQEGYKVLAMDTLTFLDHAYREMEADQIYQTIGIANQIFWTDSANKETLFYSIRTHDVWRDPKFWRRAAGNELDCEMRVQRNTILREYQRTHDKALFDER